MTKPTAGVKPPCSAQYQSLVQHSYDTILLLAEDATIRYATPAISRVLGYDPAEVVGLDALTLVHPEDAALVETAFARVLTQGRNRGTTYRCRTRQGDWRWLESNATNLLRDPAVRAVVVNSRDVTERRQAEIERATNLALFQALLENMPSGVLVVDGAGRVVAANEQLCHMFSLGTPCAALRGMAQAAVSERMLQVLVDGADFLHRTQAMAAHRTPVADAPIHLADGRDYACDYYPIVARTWAPEQWETLDDAFYAFYDEERTVVPDTFVGHCWRYGDITERLRLEAQARASEARFRAAVETMREGFIILSAVRDEYGRIVDFRYEYINGVASRVNGFGPEQHVGRLLTDVLPHVRQTTLIAQYAHVVHTGQPLRKDSAVMESLDEQGRPYRRYFDYQVVKLDDGIAVTGREISE